ncbi:MAG TPA: RsmE family RNA methyltransferase [Candidatus Limnocylindrales bacterium]|nr:RsmE family RNA methyltransferase [Candidatus Limnocylindrales bacterium]
MSRLERVPDSPFWVEPGSVDAGSSRLRLSAEESHHLLRVFRATPGTSFEAIDGQGMLYRCELEGAEGGVAVARIESREAGVRELPAAMALLVGLPEFGQAEAVIEHAVPLGATWIDFVAASRSGREAYSGSRLERLERLSRAALKQSRRTRKPVLRSSGTLEEALAAAPGPAARFAADPDGAAGFSLGNTPILGRERAVVLAVGPPGGFLPEEAELLRAAEFKPISLGPSRLSTSTAAIDLLALARNLVLASGLPTS